MPSIRDVADQFEKDKPKQVEDSIQSNNFGGLNTTANPINCPYSDSPFLTNISVDISGNVNKRRGTYLLYNSVTPTQGASMMPFTTGLGYNHVVVKSGSTLFLFEVINDVATIIMSKTSVFTSAAQFVKPSFVRTSEVEPRLLLFTGVNKPVQLKFAEQQTTTTLGSPATSIVIPDTLTRYVHAATENMVVYVDRVRQTNPSFSYSAGNLTVGNITLATGTRVVDICIVTWAWWAEAMRWQGNRYYQITTRNNATNADLSIPIPLFARTDLNPLRSGNNNFNIVPYNQAALPNGYSNPNTNKPSTATTFGFSDGGVYTPSALQSLNPSSLFITFGALSGSTPLPLYWIRRRELRLNNNIPLVPTAIDVFVDGVKRNQIRTAGPTPVAQDYFLFSDDGIGNAVAILNNTTPALYLSFEWETQIGVNFSSFVEVVNNNKTHIGFNALSTREPYRDGGYVPAFGIGLFADYLNGFYPRQVSLYQGRVVLGGFPHIPLQVVFSAVTDTIIPGSFYNYYQITDDLSGTPNDPFDVVVSSTPDDRAISFQEWQGNLFCFTRRGVFRIAGINQPLSAISSAVDTVATMGLVNEQCVVVTDTSMMYLSDFGVFDLVPYTVSGEYQVRERTLKIRDKFGVTLNPNLETLPWLKYDQAQRIVYLGYPVEGEFYTCRKLFVYSTFRESWTEYDTPGSFQSFSAGSYTDRALGTRFGMLCTRFRSAIGIPSDLCFIRFDDTRYIDFRQRYVESSSGSGISQPTTNALPTVTFTTKAGQRGYSTTYSETRQSTAFLISPYTNVQDCLVTLNGIKLTFDVDYKKLPSGNVYLLADPGVGKTLNITARRPIADSLEGQALYNTTAPFDASIYIVYIDNVLQSDLSGVYTFQTIGTAQFMTITSRQSAVVELGVAYMAIYSTPVFNAGTLGNYKRITHVLAFMSNVEAQETYTADDVNTLASQATEPIVDLYKTRVGCDFLVQYSSTQDVDISYDAYGYSTLVWDDSTFDIAPTARAFNKYQLLKQPIIGTGYAIQFIIFSYDEAYFSLAGYQLPIITKGRRVISAL